MNIDIFLQNIKLLLLGPFPDGQLGGLSLNLLVAAGALSLGFLLSLPLGLARKAQTRLLRWPATCLIEAVKAVPVLLLVFWAYLLLPLLFPTDLPPFISALMSFTVYSTVYLAETLRAGIDTIPATQRDAALASGMHYYQWQLHVCLPQAIRRMIPCYASFFISIFKDTSVLYIIGIMDILQYGLTMAESHPDRIMTIYGQMGLCLFVVCQTIGFIAAWLEKRFEMADCQMCRKVVGQRSTQKRSKATLLPSFQRFINKPTNQ